MELNTRGRYAVMAMADVAKHGAGASVPLSAVAERQKLSLDYLEQIFLKLRRAGLVESTRGRLGGYKLGRPGAEITIAEIMSAVDEETKMTRCSPDETGGCIGGERCVTHELWHALGENIERFLSGVTLQDVLDRSIGAKERMLAHSAETHAS
jgi:Rrf2 family transcriptional regulator, iron-sulfur cluster assembly transcription factor